MRFTAYGVPAPQGSKRAFVVKGRAVMTEASKRLPEWRDAVVTAAREAMAGEETITGPCAVSMRFYMPRPKTVKREFPSVAPDFDKLARGVADALTIARVIRDDALIVSAHVLKRYTDSAPGVEVNVWEEKE